MRLFIALFFMWWLPVAASSEVLTWKCDFNFRIDAKGKHDEKMLLVFKVDTHSKKAYMEGNAGIVEVDFHVGESAVSFTQLVGSGAIQTTTVTRDGKVVHSRNTVFLGEIVAAQHFGVCQFN